MEGLPSGAYNRVTIIHTDLDAITQVVGGCDVGSEVVKDMAHHENFDSIHSRGAVSQVISHDIINP